MRLKAKQQLELSLFFIVVIVHLVSFVLSVSIWFLQVCTDPWMLECVMTNVKLIVVLFGWQSSHETQRKTGWTLVCVVVGLHCFHVPSSLLTLCAMLSVCVWWYWPTCINDLIISLETRHCEQSEWMPIPCSPVDLSQCNMLRWPHHQLVG